MPAASQLTDPSTTHGEGPVWDPAGGRLCWVDMLTGDVLTLHPDLSVTRHHLGGMCCAFRFRTAGGIVLSTERGFALVDGEFRSIETFPDLWTSANIRMNDGACDPQGRFYCGSMAYDDSPGQGSLFRLNPDRTTEVVLTDVTISNGLAWSPDGGTVYFVDTPTQRIDAFDFDPATGAFSNRRPVIEIETADGCPDGIAVDVAGNIWVATWTGRSVRCYTAAGALQDVVSVPAVRVTACAFGGDDLRTLYITTSRLGLAPGESDPLGGALFAIECGLPGIPVAAFCG